MLTLLREPDLVNRLRAGREAAACTHCTHWTRCMPHDLHRHPVPVVGPLPFPDN